MHTLVMGLSLLIVVPASPLPRAEIFSNGEMRKLPPGKPAPCIVRALPTDIMPVLGHGSSKYLALAVLRRRPIVVARETVFAALPFSCALLSKM